MKTTMTVHVCLLAALGMTALQAETISGAVYDASGAVIPKVAVSVTNAETKIGQFTVTGEDGTFSVAGLAPGSYRVDFEARGFQASREYTQLKTGAALTLAPILSIGRVRETISVKSQGTPAYQGGPVKVRVGGNVEPAKLLKQARMAYPEAAKAKGAMGSVLVRAVILTSGALSSPVIVKSPDPDLTASALAALKQWRYEPTKLNGQPVETETLIEVSFDLVP